MRIGFLGTGTISEAIVRGICSSDFHVDTITLSPRNEKISQALANEFACVHIGEDNQKVVDNSDIVFIALRAQVAEDILKELQFRADQKLVTLIASATTATVVGWTGGKSLVLRAVPLPFVAEHKSATPIYPADDDLKAIFSNIGGVIVADNEHQFNLFMTAGSLMGVYFRFIETANQWMDEKGLAASQSAPYLAKLFASLADKTLETDNANFKLLEREYSTKGGTNELIAELFAAEGGVAALKTALDQAFTKISKS